MNILHIGPSLEEARGAVILVHGRGSSGEAIARLSDALPSDGVAWLAPTAEHGAWYPHRFLVPVEQNEPWLGQALTLINRLVTQAGAAGIPSDRLGLIGFSQGACLALEYVYRHPRRYGFVGGLSGGLIGPLETPRPAVDLQQTPILLGCAEKDAHIPFPFVEESENVFFASNAVVTLQKYPGFDHTVFPEEVEWLTAHLDKWGAEK